MSALTSSIARRMRPAAATALRLARPLARRWSNTTRASSTQARVSHRRRSGACGVFSVAALPRNWALSDGVVSRAFSSSASASSSGAALADVDASKLQVTLTDKPKELQPLESLIFGHSFTDHMLEVDWDAETGWHAPRISPYHNLDMDPASSCLHYGLQCFEGLKAYIDADGKIRMFRPDRNMARMNKSMERLLMPQFDEEQMLQCIKELLKVEKRWIPNKDGYSLYIRPTGISTHAWLGVGQALKAKVFVILSPVGPYYKTGFAPVRLLADPQYVRAWPGGTGANKVGGNYAMGIKPAQEAAARGFAQLLWLYGDEHWVTEVGTMNQFFLWKRPGDGKTELVTAPLDDGTILPGVTRDSILALCREWNEFEVVERRYTINEVVSAIDEGRMIESFGAGTAAIVSPVNGVHFDGVDYEVPIDSELNAGKLTHRLAHAIMDIQYGRAGDHPWSVVVD